MGNQSAVPLKAPTRSRRCGRDVTSAQPSTLTPKGERIMELLKNAPPRFSRLNRGNVVLANSQLVANLRGSLGLSRATLTAALQAEQAAHNLEEALPGWELRRAYLDTARQARDSVGAQWDSAYSALRHLALSYVEQPDLYATLF